MLLQGPCVARWETNDTSRGPWRLVARIQAKYRGRQANKQVQEMREQKQAAQLNSKPLRTYQ